MFSGRHRSPPGEMRELIFETYFDRTYKVALTLTRDPLLAQDVTQETFAIAFTRMHQLRDPSKMGAWLAAIAINVARASKNARDIPTAPEVLRAICEDVEAPDNVELVAEQHETACEIKPLIQALPAEQQQVILLHYYYDLPLDEIAEMLDIPIGTVKSRLGRARDKIRQALHQQSETSRANVGWRKP